MKHADKVYARGKDSQNRAEFSSIRRYCAFSYLLFGLNGSTSLTSIVAWKAMCIAYAGLAGTVALNQYSIYCKADEESIGVDPALENHTMRLL